MPELTFKVGDFTYNAKSMNARIQLRVVKKSAPLVASGLPEIIEDVAVLSRRLELAQEADPNAQLTIPDILQAVGGLRGAAMLVKPMADELSKISDEDSWSIIRDCLSLCTRQRDGERSFLAVWNVSEDRPLSDDLNYDLWTTLRVTAMVYDGNLRSFFREGPFGFLGGARKGPTS